jgi:uncharacterized protein
VVNPEKVILFGSYARGEAKPDSDLDLIIVEKEPFSRNRSRWQEITKIRNSVSSYKVPKDILLFSIDEVEKWKNSQNHIVGTALIEGKIMYERY